MKYFKLIADLLSSIAQARTESAAQKYHGHRSHWE
jgi:hypothetical protein